MQNEIIDIFRQILNGELNPELQTIQRSTASPVIN